jgi:hypothetical protein
MNRNSLDEQTTLIAEPSAKPVPPDEGFWQRYSPHHELFLSLSSSGLVHVAVVGLLVVAGIMAVQLSRHRPITIEVLPVGEGGGRPDAGGGQAPGSEPVEDLPKNLAPAETKIEPAPVAPLNPVDVALPPLVAPEKERPLDQGLRNSLEDLRKMASGKLRPGPARPGPGSEYGPPGDGPERPGGRLSIQQQRLLRWVMIFNIRQPEDYARQLQDLKAILAIPIAGKDKEFQVIEDLSKRPVQPKAKDVTQIDRIYWRDDRPESVASLARVLGITPAPPYFVAFFPQELEKKLLEKELAHAHGKPEGMIEETRFQIRSTAKGYEPVVIDQRYRESTRTRR